MHKISERRLVWRPLHTFIKLPSEKTFLDTCSFVFRHAVRNHLHQVRHFQGSIPGIVAQHLWHDDLAFVLDPDICLNEFFFCQLQFLINILGLVGSDLSKIQESAQNPKAGEKNNLVVYFVIGLIIIGLIIEIISVLLGVYH